MENKGAFQTQTQEFAPSAPPPSYEDATSSYTPAMPMPMQMSYGGPPAMSPAVPVQPLPYPQQSYVPLVCQPAPARTTIVVQVGPRSAQIQCPQCHEIVKTKTHSESQKSAHIACLILCLFGCCLCSCLPYCIDSFRDVHHKCPKCNGFIGTYKH